MAGLVSFSIWITTKQNIDFTIHFDKGFLNSLQWDDDKNIDGIEKLIQSGVTAVIQPSGSIRDKEIIKFANATDTVLVFSKTRHFRH